jgi:Ribonucleases G and E
MRMLTPSYARNVKHYKEAIPLFSAHNLEQQLSELTKPQVSLPSGGYLVMNSTEALVAVDVNSGKSTKEVSIEDTALRTNLEAADEVARQLRLRDLGGLVVIDFIDMDDNRHNRQVEKRLKDALKLDRARIQIGKISNFGLLEMSRQRLRPSMVEVAFMSCPHCHGEGLVRNPESACLELVRLLESYLPICKAERVVLKLLPDLVNFVANEKRDAITRLEMTHAVRIIFDVTNDVGGDGYKIIMLDTERQEIAPPVVTPSLKRCR